MSWPRLAVGAPRSPVEPSSFLFMFFAGSVPLFSAPVGLYQA